MNLLDKNWSGLLIFTALAIFSCEDPSEVGLGLDPDGVNSGVYYEEIPLSAQNVFIDSLRTSGSSRFLVGSTVDPVFGTTSSMGLTRLSISSGVQSLPYRLDTVSTDPLVVDTIRASYVVDSAVLRLAYDYVNTNEKPVLDQTIRVQEVDDQLFSGVYYLHNFETPVLPVEEGNEFPFIPRLDSLHWVPSSFDTVKFYLNDSWKDRLFDIARQPNRSAILRDEFKGLALSGGVDNKAIVGFLASQSELKIHYHIMADTTYADSLSVSYSLSAASAKYNKISTDRTGSVIGNVIGENLQNFDTGDGYVYLQAASGIYPKIDMQPFLDFLDRPGNELIQINNLEFEISAVYQDTILNQSISSARMMFIGEQGQINIAGLQSQGVYNTGVLSDVGYLSAAQQFMEMSIDTTATKMTGVATLFGQSVENEYIKDLEYLVLMPSNLSNANRTVIPADSIKMKIFFSNPN
ncbi:DUF4270 domain-containing protein [Reichenbachiella ulvae]|uniref:DUF4270 domain-containing protein n=1 Tax=Reichenbachiella ulvae TaxID=2980104 RepID=A0ABT3CWF9_9BACT|nr:DUF4270 domain-containing protein [Reichenbachiella ulvae]MCV9387901.1 DUF4270 domain-containing protein [Reichenbachiella ulvae]